MEKSRDKIVLKVHSDILPVIKDTKYGIVKGYLTETTIYYAVVNHLNKTIKADYEVTDKYFTCFN